jgi:hypothetical protein
MNQTAPRISLWKNFGKPPGRKIRTRTMKGNKTMKTTTSFTYPAFALFVLTCFALSPQAFAEPTLIPPSGVCASGTTVKVCCTTPNVTRIHVRYGSIQGDLQSVACPTGCAGSRCGQVYVPHPNTLTAECWVGTNKVGTATGSYTKTCSLIFWVIGGTLVAAVLIWWLVKKSSANRSINHVSVG